MVKEQGLDRIHAVKLHSCMLFTSLYCSKSKIVSLPLISKCDYFVLEIVLGMTREDGDRKLHLLNIHPMPDFAQRFMYLKNTFLFNSYTK